MSDTASKNKGIPDVINVVRGKIQVATWKGFREVVVAAVQEPRGILFFVTSNFLFFRHE